MESSCSTYSVCQIMSDMEFEGASLSVVKAALGTLMKEGLVTEVGVDRYAVESAVKAAGKETYEITIEKIYQGSAVVRVNDKWRARLTPEDYNGPRNLIKKNSRFSASAKLYRVGGTLCVRVKDVIQVLS